MSMQSYLHVSVFVQPKGCAPSSPNAFFFQKEPFLKKIFESFFSILKNGMKKIWNEQTNWSKRERERKWMKEQELIWKGLYGLVLLLLMMASKSLRRKSVSLLYEMILRSPPLVKKRGGDHHQFCLYRWLRWDKRMRPSWSIKSRCRWSNGYWTISKLRKSASHWLWWPHIATQHGWLPYGRVKERRTIINAAMSAIVRCCTTVRIGTSGTIRRGAGSWWTSWCTAWSLSVALFLIDGSTPLLKLRSNGWLCFFNAVILKKPRPRVVRARLGGICKSISTPVAGTTGIWSGSTPWRIRKKSWRLREKSSFLCPLHPAAGAGVRVEIFCLCMTARSWVLLRMAVSSKDKLLLAIVSSQRRQPYREQPSF